MKFWLDYEKRMHIALALGLVCGGVSLAAHLRPGLMDDELAGFLAGLSGGMIVCWVCFMLLPRWWRDAIAVQHETKAGRQYMRRMVPSMFAYVIFLPASMLLIRRGIDTVWLRALVALLPVLPIASVLIAFIGYIRNADEFQRKVELESIGVAALLVSLGYMSAGFLQLAHVIHFDAGAAMIWVFPVLCMGYGLGKLLAMRRYQ